MKSSLLTRILLALVLLAVAGGAGFGAWAYRGRSVAMQRSAQGAWRECRDALERYLWLCPNDAEARLLMAEAYVRDEKLPAEHAVSRAAEFLQGVPDEAPLGSVARAKEARIRFLLMRQPYRAEALFRRSLELDPGSEENWYLLWKILELTGRYDSAAPVFWRLYELTPVSRRAVRLREWYMSQFFPRTANVQFDRMLGFLNEGEMPTAVTEYHRLLDFRDRDPSSPAATAALAHWFQTEGDQAFALKLLEDRKSLRAPFDDPDYLETLVSVEFELGLLDRAAEHFRNWPEPPAGYEYWVLRGMIYDEVFRDDTEALRAYETALSTWPGPVDWRTQYRMAHCLARLNQHQRAREVREAAKAVQGLMDEEVHEQLRLVLADLENAEGLGEIVDYYRKLGCPLEVEAWSEHIARLPTRNARPGTVETASQAVAPATGFLAN